MCTCIVNVGHSSFELRLDGLQPETISQRLKLKKAVNAIQVNAIRVRAEHFREIVKVKVVVTIENLASTARPFSVVM